MKCIVLLFILMVGMQKLEASSSNDRPSILQKRLLQQQLPKRDNSCYGRTQKGCRDCYEYCIEPCATLVCCECVIPCAGACWFWRTPICCYFTAWWMWQNQDQISALVSKQFNCSMV